MQEAVPEGQGAMAAVMAASTPRSWRRPARRRGARAAAMVVVAPANYNSPAQTVIAGDAAAAVESAACAAAGERGAPGAHRGPAGLRALPLRADGARRRQAGSPSSGAIPFQRRRAPAGGRATSRRSPTSDGSRLLTQRRCSEPLQVIEWRRPVDRFVEVVPGRLAGLNGVNPASKLEVVGRGTRSWPSSGLVRARIHRAPGRSTRAEPGRIGRCSRPGAEGADHFVSRLPGCHPHA